MSVKIVADSTCDLSMDLIQRYSITITPLYLVEGEHAYRDMIDINPERLFQMIEQEGKKFGTSAVNTNDYRTVYEQLRADGSEIVQFTISSDMSSCYQNACLAAQEVGGVYVIDSRSLSCGIGLLALEAAEMAESGTSAQEIVQAVESRKEKVDVTFILNTLDYLARGGRCSAISAFGANLMQIRPSIAVRNGKMGVAKKYRGQSLRCMIKYIKDQLAEVDTLDLSRIVLASSGLEPEILAQLEQTILECAPFQEVLHTQAGCTISNHCGPRCMGILFFRK